MRVIDAEWEVPKTKIYRIHIGFIYENGGGVSALVLNLPGAASQGENELEARANVREAVQGVILSYRDDDKPIPWLGPGEYEVPDDVAREVWLTVEA